MTSYSDYDRECPPGIFDSDDDETDDLQTMIQASEAARNKKTQYTAAELMGADFPEVSWIVPGLIPVGLTSLSGRPKVGKSLLASLLACRKARGVNFLEGILILEEYLASSMRIPLKDYKTGFASKECKPVTT